MDPNNPRDEENEQPENNDGDLLPQIRGGEPKLKLRDTGVMPRKASRPRKAPRRPDHAQLRKEARSKILMPGWSTDTVREEQVDNSGFNALHMVIFCEYGLDELKKLLDRDFDPNRPNSHGMTPVHIGIEKTLPEYVEMLKEHGGSLTTVDKMGRTPPFYMKRFDYQNLFLDDLVDYNPIDRVGSNLFQHILKMSTHFRTESILEFICKGADYKNVNYMNENCLHIMAGHTHFEDAMSDGQYLCRVARKLMRKGGIDLNAKNYELETPLHVGTITCSILIQDLLRAGADVNVVNRYHETPIKIATDSPNEVIGALFIKHFIFRRHRGLSVDYNNFNLLCSDDRFVPYLHLFDAYIRCLQSKKLIPSDEFCELSYYDILCSNRKRLREIVRNPKIKKKFAYSYQKYCPYGIEIHEQWREAVTTVNLQDRCLTILQDLMNTIPYLIIKNIVQFLSKPDMREMIESNNPEESDMYDTDDGATDEEDYAFFSYDSLTNDSSTDDSSTDESSTDDSSTDEN